jgi:hypothetical protein
MTKPAAAMIRVLREAKYFGDLVEREGKIYSRRHDAAPFCSRATVNALVAHGWLQRWRSSLVISKGKFAEREL